MNLCGYRKALVMISALLGLTSTVFAAETYVGNFEFKQKGEIAKTGRCTIMASDEGYTFMTWRLNDSETGSWQSFSDDAGLSSRKAIKINELILNRVPNQNLGTHLDSKVCYSPAMEGCLLLKGLYKSDSQGLPTHVGFWSPDINLFGDTDFSPEGAAKYWLCKDLKPQHKSLRY